MFTVSENVMVSFPSVLLKGVPLSRNNLVSRFREFCSLTVDEHSLSNDSGDIRILCHRDVFAEGILPIS